MNERNKTGLHERYVKPVVRAVVGWGFHFPLSYLSTEWDEQVKPWLQSKGRTVSRGIERLRSKKDEGPRSED